MAKNNNGKVSISYCFRSSVHSFNATLSPKNMFEKHKAPSGKVEINQSVICALHKTTVLADGKAQENTHAGSPLTAGCAAAVPRPPCRACILGAKWSIVGCLLRERVCV
jgi:hypothetical protein